MNKKPLYSAIESKLLEVLAEGLKEKTVFSITNNLNTKLDLTSPLPPEWVGQWLSYMHTKKGLLTLRRVGSSLFWSLKK